MKHDDERWYLVASSAPVRRQYVVSNQFTALRMLAHVRPPDSARDSETAGHDSRQRAIGGIGAVWLHLRRMDDDVLYFTATHLDYGR